MDPVARHVVVAGALVRDGRVLLCHRHPDRAWYPDVWDLPGGHLEPGEDAGRALRRELHEELGVRADPDPRPLWSRRSPDMDLTVLWVLGWRGEPSVVDEREHDALGWLPPQRRHGSPSPTRRTRGSWRRSPGGRVARCTGDRA